MRRAGIVQASISRPKPTLWPPALRLRASNRPERVSLTPRKFILEHRCRRRRTQTWPNHLLQRNADLTHVVHFRSERSERIHLILRCQCESCLVRTSRPGQLHACFQTIVEALVDAATELVSIVTTRSCSQEQVRRSVVRLHVAQQAEIFGSKSDGKVILGQGGFGSAVNVLVTGEPALVTDNDSSVQDGTRSVEADVRFDMRLVVSESGAKIGGLLSTTQRGVVEQALGSYPVLGARLASNTILKP